MALATSLTSDVVKFALSEGYSPESLTEQKTEILDAYNSAHQKTGRKNAKRRGMVSVLLPNGDVHEVGEIDFRKKDALAVGSAWVLANAERLGISMDSTGVPVCKVITSVITTEEVDCGYVGEFLRGE